MLVELAIGEPGTPDDPFEQGRRARRDGISLDENPYSNIECSNPQTAELAYLEWRDGWNSIHTQLK